jgi:MFS family permease
VLRFQRGLSGFIDTTIIDVALPPIRERLGFPVGSLQWVISGYLFTYGGFLLPGGCAADCSAAGGCWSPEPCRSGYPRWSAGCRPARRC